MAIIEQKFRDFILNPSNEQLLKRAYDSLQYRRHPEDNLHYPHQMEAKYDHEGDDREYIPLTDDQYAYIGWVSNIFVRSGAGFLEEHEEKWIAKAVESIDPNQSISLQEIQDIILQALPYFVEQAESFWLMQAQGFFDKEEFHQIEPVEEKAFDILTEEEWIQFFRAAFARYIIMENSDGTY